MIDDPFQAELDRYYGYKGENFVRYTHRMRVNCLRDLIGRFPVSASPAGRMKALDAGTGFGVYSILMAEAGYDVTAIDINDREIDSARQWAAARGVLDRIEYKVGDLEKMSDGADVFDLIICSEVLEHLDHPDLGARNLHRLLKPGGAAIVSMPNMACLLGAMQWCFRKSGIRTLLGKPPLDEHQIKHSRYWFGSILRLLRNAGFRVERVSGSSHLPFIWNLDAFLTRTVGAASLCGRADRLAGRIPGWNYLGFNLIVLLRKS
jgi:2-polyprenyl-3-methyl-5-hydroxy-6-metoxy-1,4-benzoquinol methylase